MIKVNVHFQEVRLIKVEYTKTKSEAGKQAEGGKVQAKEAGSTAAPKRESFLSRIFG